MNNQRTLHHSADFVTMPLGGRQLIEANAGTGKTWTICAIYARLIVVEGYRVENILVLTYTRAAVAELSSRIRHRLMRLQSTLEKGVYTDEYNQQLCAACVDIVRSRVCLALALSSLEQMAAYTIHAFCQRILSQMASHTGFFNHARLSPEEARAAFEQAVCDFWRQYVVSLQAFPPHPLCFSQACLETWLMQGGSIVLLKKKMYTLIQRNKQGRLQGMHPPNDVLQHTWSTWLQLQASIHECLETQEDEIITQLTSGVLNANQYKKNIVKQWLSEVALFAQKKKNLILPTFFAKLTQQAICQATHKKCAAPHHVFFSLMSECVVQHARVYLWYAYSISQLYALAVEKIEQFFSQHKATQHIFDFDDLLYQLDRSLENDQTGVLKKTIVTQFPVILLDECQDTDLMQYKMMDHIWGTVGIQIFVGDPKQAIYGFRGADVVAYLHVRRALPEQHCYQLSTNRRSVEGLVQVVNFLFQRRADIFVTPGITFCPVHTVYRAQLVDPNPDHSVCRIWFLQDKQLSRAQCVARISRAVATEIAFLLHQAQPSSIRYQDRALQASDIAVLVRSHYQAKEVARALSAVQISTSYRVRESIFLQEEAVWVEHYLAVLRDPTHVGAVRALLLTGLCALCEEAMDDQCVLQWVEHAVQWAKEVSVHGFVFVLRDLLRRCGAYQRFSQQKNGLQHLTHLFHLAELIACSYDRDRQLDRVQLWFAQQREQASQGFVGDEAILRAVHESTEVTIVTQHAAKGLEYPVVFCPFLFLGDTSHETSCWHTPNGEVLCDFLSSHSEQSLQDQLAESIRLAYVAFTRAQERCYLVWAQPVARKQDFFSSPLFWLLADDHWDTWSARKKLSEDFMQQQRLVVEQLCTACSSVAVYDLPIEKPMVSCDVCAGPVSPIVQRILPTLRPSWHASSFSDLMAHVAYERSIVQIDTDTRCNDEIAQLWKPFVSTATIGHLVHHILQNIVYSCPKMWHTVITQSLRYYMGSAAEDLQANLYQLVDYWMDVPLLPGGVCLASVDAVHREVYFMLKAHKYSLQKMFHQLEKYQLACFQTPSIVHQGFLSGYIDLVAVHQQQFYVIDWKTHDLGSHSSCYSPPILRQVMQKGGYFCQAILYATAVHLWLKKHLLCYHYDQHFGGISYVFLRGLRRTSLETHCGLWHYRPPVALIEDFAACLDGHG